jgi:hypothetical protein
VDDESIVTGMMGLYYDKDLVDWFTLRMTFNNDASKITWKCDDGHSTIVHVNEIEQDERINCFIDDSKTTAELYDSKGQFTGSFIKPFRTDDTNEQDIILKPMTHVGAQLRVQMPQEKRATYQTIVLPNLDPNYSSSVWIKAQIAVLVLSLITSITV